MEFWKHTHSIKGLLVVDVEITLQYVLLQCALALFGLHSLVHYQPMQFECKVEMFIVTPPPHIFYFRSALVV